MGHGFKVGDGSTDYEVEISKLVVCNGIDTESCCAAFVMRLGPTDTEPQWRKFITRYDFARGRSVWGKYAECSFAYANAVDRFVGISSTAPYHTPLQASSKRNKGLYSDPTSRYQSFMRYAVYPSKILSLIIAHPLSSSLPVFL